MRVRKFNESINRQNISEEYLNDLFQVFIDYGWKVKYTPKLIVNDDLGVVFDEYYKYIKTYNKNSIYKVTNGVDIILKKVNTDIIQIDSLKEYDNATHFFIDIRSKLNILEADNIQFLLNYIGLNSINIIINNTSKVLLDKAAINKIEKLSKEGLKPDFCEIIDTNKLEIEYPSGNNTNFARLYKKRIDVIKTNQITNLEFEKWFDENFKLTIESNPNDSEDTIVALTIL